MEIVITILASMTASGALTAGLVFLTKTWISERLKNAIKHEYDEKLESHKAQLKAESDAALERLRADLRIASFERETRFAKLHELRAETIAESYARLEVMFQSVFHYVREVGPPSSVPLDERRASIRQAITDFNDYFRPRRIYVSADTEERITDFETELFKITRIFKVGVEDERDAKTGRDSWGDAADRLEATAKPMFEKLRLEFRELLGDRTEIAE